MADKLRLTSAGGLTAVWTIWLEPVYAVSDVNLSFPQDRERDMAEPGYREVTTNKENEK